MIRYSTGPPEPAFATPWGLRVSDSATSPAALVELVGGVLRRELDGDEPRLARAVAQAAKDIVDSRLTGPDLSPSMPARELSISVGTPHRVFAAAGESVGACFRRRLEQARLRLLAAPRGRLSVSELAAHWQFADSSHFIRAFEQQYGRTPAQYARAHDCHRGEGSEGSEAATRRTPLPRTGPDTGTAGHTARSAAGPLPPPGRRRGGAYHEFGGEFDVVGLGLLTACQPEGGAQGGTAHLPQRLAHGGQRW